MHVPDGFLSGRVAVTAAALAAGGVALAVWQARKSLPPRKVPLMGLSAAFVFAAQMLNFPVAAGTSGHLVGGVLAGVLLGPAPAVVVLTCVLVVQCLVFADGGLLALGANVFNMAVVGAVGGYGIYRACARVLPGEKGRLAAVAIAAWAATVLASVVCAAELALSGIVPWRTALPTMAGVHAVIGVGEAAITTMVVYSVSRARPELLRAEESGRVGFPAAVAYGLIITLGLAAFVAPLASPWPDGLEHVAERLGFADNAAEPAAAPIPDYEMPGVSSAALATGLAGVAGVLVTFLAVYWAMRLASVGRRDAAKPAG
jgi:cobalt/nickel transport system permease protein